MENVDEVVILIKTGDKFHRVLLDRHQEMAIANTVKAVTGEKVYVDKTHVKITEEKELK